jgi:hypothetical protein
VQELARKPGNSPENATVGVRVGASTRVMKAYTLAEARVSPRCHNAAMRRRNDNTAEIRQ